MARAAEYALICVIGALFIFLFIVPAVQHVTDEFNQGATCLQSGGKSCS